VKQVPGRESSIEALRPMTVVCSVPVTADAPIEMACAGEKSSIHHTDRDVDGLTGGVGAHVDHLRLKRTCGMALSFEWLRT